MAKRTVWEGRDRRGLRYFLARPSFDAGFSFFSGKEIDVHGVERNRRRYRIIRAYFVKVNGPSTLMSAEGLKDRMRYDGRAKRKR